MKTVKIQTSTSTHTHLHKDTQKPELEENNELWLLIYG